MTVSLWRTVTPQRLSVLVGVVLALSGYVVTAQPISAVGEAEVQDTSVANNLGLFGIQPMDITTDPSNGDYVYTASYTPNGIFHSSDGGVTWQGLPSTVDYGAGRDVTVDATTGDVYAMVGDDIIKSTDHGATWTALTENLVDHPIMGAASIFANGVYMFAASGGQVQISTDKGESFISVVVNGSTTNTSSQNVISLAASATGVFYAVFQDENGNTGSTLFRSTTNGQSWTNMNVDTAGVAVGSRFYGVAVDPDNVNHLVLSSYHPDYNSYHSLDGGSSWTVLQNGTIRIGGDEAVFTGAGRLYIGTYYTDNPQVVTPTWTAVNQTTPLSSVRGDIYAVNYQNPLTVFTNTGLGIAKTEDGGSTWTDQVEGLTALQTFAISQADDKDVVWIGANGGLAKTTNFTAKSPDWEFPITPDSGISAVKAVWVHPTDSNRVVAGLSGFISISTDGGATWNHASGASFMGTVEYIIPSPRDNQILYALYTNTSLTEDAYNGGVLKSVDAGSTWTELNFPTTLGNGALAVGVNNDEDVLYVGLGSGGTETGVYTFNGTSWTKLDESFNGLYVNNILVHPDDNTMLLVSCEAYSTVGSLFKSTDSGITWTTITTGLEDTNHLDAMAAQTGATAALYLSGQAGGTSYGMIYKSTDNGDSWSPYYQGLKQEFFYALLFDGLVGANDRGLYEYKTRATIKLKRQTVANKTQLKITLKDAATNKQLAKQRVKIYSREKKGKPWRRIATVKTNAKGKAIVMVSATAVQLQARWTPKKTYKNEYIKAQSKVVK